MTTPQIILSAIVLIAVYVSGYFAGKRRGHDLALFHDEHRDDDANTEDADA